MRREGTTSTVSGSIVMASQPNPLDPTAPAVRLIRPEAGLDEGKRDWTLPKPPALSSGPDATALWKGFCRRWPLALILGTAVAAAVFALVYLLVPDRFKAFGLLQISSSKPSLTLEGSESRGDFQTYLKTQAARIKSRDVLMKALNQDTVRNLHLVQKHPDTLSTLAWLEENLKIETQDGSEIMEVALYGEDPNDLTVLVNALTKSYLSIINNHEKSQKKERASKMKMLYEQAKEKLSEKVAAREAILSGHGAKDAAAMLSKQHLLQSQLSRTQEKHQMVAFELMRKDLYAQLLTAGKKKAEEFALPETAAKDLQETDPLLRQDLQTLKGVERAITKLEQEGHPPTDFDLRKLRANANKLRSQVEERTKELLAEAQKRIKGRGEEEHLRALEALQIDLLPLKKQEEELRNKVAELQNQTDSVIIESGKEKLINSEIEQAEANVTKLHAQYSRVLVDEESDNRVHPVGEAEWQKLSSKKRTMMMLMGPLMAFAVVALALAWMESTARRITTADEVSTGLSLRVVGTVPVLPQPGSAEATAEMGHNLVESIDSIRTMLLRSARSDKTRIVLVTSAVSGEGKTTLASNLAVSLAKVGKKTLLMDCDLRGPAVHQLFEQQLQPGFSEALLGEVPLADTLRQTNDPNLWVLPAGHWDREVIQELAKNGLEAMFERLKEEFDFILVDSHPILAANDALLIGQQVDAVILSLMRELSQADNVYQACQKLASLGIEVFGTVINGVPAKEYKRGAKYVAHEQHMAEQAAQKIVA